MLDSVSTEKREKATKYNKTTYEFNPKEVPNHVSVFSPSEVSTEGTKRRVPINKTSENKKQVVAMSRPRCGCEPAIPAADLSLALGA